MLSVLRCDYTLRFQVPLQGKDLLDGTLSDDHGTQNRVCGQRSADRGINDVNIVSAENLGVCVDTGVEAAAARPVLHVAKGVVGR